MAHTIHPEVAIDSRTSDPPRDPTTLLDGLDDLVPRGGKSATLRGTSDIRYQAGAGFSAYVELVIG